MAFSPQDLINSRFLPIDELLERLDCEFHEKKRDQSQDTSITLRWQNTGTHKCGRLINSIISQTECIERYYLEAGWSYVHIEQDKALKGKSVDITLYSNINAAQEAGLAIDREKDRNVNKAGFWRKLDNSLRYMRSIDSSSSFLSEGDRKNLREVVKDLESLTQYRQMADTRIYDNIRLVKYATLPEITEKPRTLIGYSREQMEIYAKAAINAERGHILNILERIL